MRSVVLTARSRHLDTVVGGEFAKPSLQALLAVVVIMTRRWMKGIGTARVRVVERLTSKTPDTLN